MTPKTTAARKPGQLVAAEKVADGKARAVAQEARAAKKADQLASTRQCAAGPSGSYGITLAKRCRSMTIRQNAALCETHEGHWRAYRKTEDYRKALVAKRAKVVHLPLAVEIEQPVETAQARMPAFATPELAATAQARRAARGPGRVNRPSSRGIAQLG